MERPIWYQYFLDTSTTTSNSKQVSLHWSWDLGEFTIQVTQGKFAAGPLSIRKVGSINACWVFDRGWIHPANLVMTNPFFWRNFAIFFRDDQNICIKNHLVNNINFWQCFILFDWPLASSFDVLECSWWFFHKFEPGLGEPSPALKDVENRLNVNRGFPERPVTPQHSNTPNLSKG